MNRVFGKKKKDTSGPAPSLEEASAATGNRISAMDGKINELEKELRVYKDKIKVTKNPTAKKQLQKRALEVLKRKRMYEQQRDATTAQQFNIDQTHFSLESAKASISTVAAMKSANQQLKQTLRHDLDINDVDELADEMAELMDDFNEINEALGRNFATPDYIDEADLDAELEMLGDELEDELLNTEDANADATPSYLLPAQPISQPGGSNSNNNNKVPLNEYGLPS